MAETYKSFTELMKTARDNQSIQQSLCDITDFIEILDDTPNADAQEVKHGEWKGLGDNSKTRTCSNCNITQTVNVYNDKVMFEYCPYCGAKMDGKAEKV